MRACVGSSPATLIHITGGVSMIAKAQLVLNGIVYSKKGDDIPVIDRDKKYTVFERAEEVTNSKGEKVINKRKFKVSNDLAALYFT